MDSAKASFGRLEQANYTALYHMFLWFCAQLSDSSVGMAHRNSKMVVIVLFSASGLLGASHRIEVPEMSVHAEIPVTRSGVFGRVKWFNNQKGYGFITHDGSPDIFVHHSSIRMDGYRTLKQGCEVCFDMLETAKGFQAVNVVPVV